MPKFRVHLQVNETPEVDTKDADVAVGAAWDWVFDHDAYTVDIEEVGDEQEAGSDSGQDGGVPA